MDNMQFRKLSDGKAWGTMATMIIGLQGKEAFVNRKPTKDWFKLRAWFSKQDRLRTNVLYDYIVTLDSSTDTLSALYEKAEQYRQEQCFKPCNAEKYKEITIEDVMNL